MPWHDVGAADEISEDTPLPATVNGRAVGVYTLGGKYYALEDICPHAEALLSQGFVEGEEIECPLHGARFHIPTGKCTKEPADRNLVCYETKLENARILVKVD
jgi:3-phenylpropionate/trans-cinnamate dioxygenase ferredoxin component